MTTCKDCAHFEACKNIYEIHGDRLSEESYSCDHFKDRSRFVELACKVGDTVYWGSFGKLMEDEIKCIIIDSHGTRMMLKRGISYDIDLINQMFFFTKEEAEQALQMLKERGQCNNTD